MSLVKVMKKMPGNQQQCCILVIHEASLMQIPGKHPLIFPATEEGKATVKRKQRTQVISNQWTRKGATTAEEKIELY